MNPFSLLSLSPSLSVTEEVIKAGYEQSAKTEACLSARNALLSPHTKLEAWMAIHNIPLKKHAFLPESIMSLFSRMAETINTVNDLAQRQSSAQTLLAQTLITKNLHGQKAGLDALNTDLSHIECEVLSAFPKLESEKLEEEANLTLQSLKFIQKWKLNLNAAYGKLF